MMHSETAIAIGRATGWRPDDTAAAHEWTAVGIGPCGRHRDSDALERSNAETAIAQLESVDPAGYAILSFGHWAVGWVEEIAYDLGNAAMVAAVDAMRASLDDYPCLDETHYCELEYQDNHPEADPWRCYGGPDCHETIGDTGIMVHVYGSTHCYCLNPSSHAPSITYPAP
jgi:hypothetical protein